MIKVKFNDEQIPREAIFDVVSDHVVSLYGLDADDTGFLTYKLNGKLLGDFSKFKTVYKQDELLVMYSDDGSVWTAPDPEPEHEDFPDIEPMPATPSLEERVSDLESAMIEIYEAMEV